MEGLALNKVRSFLTMLEPHHRVAAVIIMMAVSHGAPGRDSRPDQRWSANLIAIQPRSAGRRQRSRAAGHAQVGDIATIQAKVTGVSGVSAEQNTTQNVKVGSVTLESIPIVGTTAGFMAVREYGVAEGRFITDADNDSASEAAVLGSTIAQKLFGNTTAVGQTIKIGSTKFTVVGVMAVKGTVGTTDYDSRIYIPIKTVFKKFVSSRFQRDAVGMVYVSAESKDTMESVKSQLTTLVMQLLETTAASPGFQLTTQDSIITTRTSTTETFRNLLAWVAGVSLIVGGIGIMNIMLVSVTERTREIGLRQALGARPRDVQLQFLLEAVALSLIGGLIGVIAGVGGSYLFNTFGSMRTELVWSSVPLAFGAAAAVGIFFGYYPATKAAQLDPIVALRRE
jgi:putative ABC transport system permease protein